ncbi:MAG: TraR/DksA family transcriptional regulator, partial [Planctomycetota bacterium]
MSGAKKEKLKKDEIQSYKKTLLARREMLLGNMARLEGEALKTGSADNAGDLSKAPSHLADLGSDSYEQELALGFYENEEEVLAEIDAALDRLDEGKFGDCETCQEFIGRERLN